MKVFIDETAWVQITDPDAVHHGLFERRFAEILNSGDKIFTHNVALGLAMAEIRERMGTGPANKFNEAIEEAYTGAHLTILWIGRRGQKEAGRKMRNNPAIPLTIFDFAAYNLMQRRRVHRVMSTKRAFRQLGLEVLPELPDEV